MDSLKKENLDNYATLNFECTDDPRLNYTFMKKECIEDFKENPELIYADKLDYGLKICEGDKTFLSPTMPISLAQIKSLEEATEWFRLKYPTLPSEYWDIMAKYYFQEPFTKKELKNGLKKLKKKGKNKQLEGFKIIHGKFKIEFD